MHFLKQKVELLPHLAGTVQEFRELKEMAAKAIQLFTDIATFGKQSGFLGKACGIDGDAAKQFLEARFETAREDGTKGSGEIADFFSLLANEREARAQIFNQVPAFGPAHVIQLMKRIEQASVEGLAQKFLIFHRLGDSGGEASDDTRQAQDGDDIDIRGGAGLLAKFLRDAHIGFREFVIHLDRRSRGRVNVDVNFDVAAMNAFTQDLAQSQFIEIESFGKAKLEVQEAMVDALDADADSPAILLAASLGVAGHGKTLGVFF
jgi:hypothetical protein